MKKKILTFILALCLFIPCGITLGACGGNGDHDCDHEWRVSVAPTLESAGQGFCPICNEEFEFPKLNTTDYTLTNDNPDYTVYTYKYKQHYDITFDFCGVCNFEHNVRAIMRENGEGVTTNNEGVQITGYTGTNTEVSIPGKIYYLRELISEDRVGYLTDSIDVYSVRIWDQDKFDQKLNAIYEKYSSGQITKEAAAALIEEMNAQKERIENITSVTIESGIERIKSQCFSTCSKLSSVTFEGESLKLIGPSAFGNTSLTSVVLPNGLEEISKHAFYNCDSLTSVVLPNGLKEIGSGAFVGTKLTELVIPDTVTKLSYIFTSYIGETDTITKITMPIVDGFDFPSSVKEVIATKQSVKFSGGENIEKFTVLGGTTSGCYKNCTKLTELNLASSITEISEDAFTGCTALTSLNIPASVTTIGSNAFKDFNGLSEIILPATLTSIGSKAFEGCNATVYTLANKSNITLAKDLGTTKIYYYSDTAPSGVEYLNNKTVVDTWHYGANNEKVQWQPNFTTNVADKTFNYSTSTVKLSDTYWAMLKEAERQGMLGELFDNVQERIDEVTSSSTKEEYESKMVAYYASTATATSVSFASDKLTLNTSAGSGQLDYVEVDGLVCCKMGSENMAWFTYENGTIYEELSNEYYTIRHIYTLAE